MLESLAAWVLKYYLGKYVENLNTDQLSIGLLQGQVELENLPLKKEALRQAGLPIQIKAGFIGKIKLQIPIRQIRSAPWVILIEKLYLVAGPVNLDEWDEEAEAQALQEQKMNALDALEAQWRANTENQDQGYYASSYSSWLNFGTSIITNIVENLQLNITDVHFRYEDEICIPGQCFTFGVAIDSLVAQSCNENWEPGFDSGPVGFKIVELSRFSIYWDDSSLSEMLGGKEGSEFMECMGKPRYRGRQFVLDHVSGVAHLKRNRSTEPLRSKTTPRIICDVLFDEFPITLSDKQYTQMILWLKGVGVISLRIKNHNFRPQCSVFENPKLWWRYAYSAVLHKIRPCRYSSETILKRIKDNVMYVKIFTKVLLSPNRAAALSPEELATKQRIEYELSFEELRVLREVAMSRASPPPLPPTKVVSGNKKNFLSTWFPQWWYSTSLPENASTMGERNSLDDEIIDVFTNTSDTTYLRRDVVFGHFNFSLKNGSVRLCAAIFENKKWRFKSLMELQFEKVLVGFEYRPRSDSYKTTLALGSIYLKDRLTKETVFPMLISPQTRENAPVAGEQRRSLTQSLSRLVSHAMAAPGTSKPADETLFQLSYEYRPFNSNADYRIVMKTQSLDVVYNPEAVNWLADFFTKPLHQGSDTNLRAAARQKYQAIKTATKNELIKNWEKILAGDLSNRKTWEIDLDISAPQIIFVEDFCDKNAVIVVIDFGHLHFSNCIYNEQSLMNKKSSDEEEAFQTPCSTPPGSGVSPANSEPQGLKTSSLCELSLHHKLYDRYELELGEMQVLVGKVRDNWKYAHLKGTSTLHVLDRFNISLQVERRIVHTNDPQFPSLTFFGNLPRLVVHVNEQKISALRAMLSMITHQGLPSPFRASEPPLPTNENEEISEAPIDETNSDELLNETSKLIIMQFTVHQLALEVQSRNRSIAELQVSEVKAATTIRPYDTFVTLSVHSLLLVDALQTFGRDFELLVASHKHVVIDSLSGSIRDSEPTSPIPPGSPEPTDNASPVAFSQVVNTMQNKGLNASTSSSQFISIPTRVTSPLYQPYNLASSPIIRALSPVLQDTEALISIELTFVSGSCPGHGGQPLQIAAIQFNNLDIIANQETIVELLGFARRVFPASKSVPMRSSPVSKETEISKSESLSRQSLGDEIVLIEQMPTKTEITFDFHRLNVLLLRAVQKDGALVGRKICTATMMQAKIKATVGEDLIVEGSLGGIQIVDLTPEGMKHQRILSLGADPLANDTISDLSAGLYSVSNFSQSKTAFSFNVKRSLQSEAQDGIDAKVRLASVWYTHSPLLVKELQSCATEFKQYLANLARSIKFAATEMAMGFVHARAEALAQSLSMSGRLSASLYGSTSDISSPKRRRRSFTQSVETLGTTPHTPYSPIDDELMESIDVRLDVVLDTPVIVLPMSPSSDQVFIAQLGKITARNTHLQSDDVWGSKIERYNIEIRNMNLYSVTTVNNLTSATLNLAGETILPRPERIYTSCDGKPILHNTVIEIVTERQVGTSLARSWDFNLDSENGDDHLQITGCVVGPLKVSLTREQYQQLLETVNNLFTDTSVVPDAEILPQSKKLCDIQEEENDSMFGVSTLSLDPALRARMFNSNSLGATPKPQQSSSQFLSLRVSFNLPEFTIELLGELGCLLENGLVSISFRDFILTYDQTEAHLSHLQMRLKSLVMEDLLVDENSKNRFLVVSSASPTPRTSQTGVSQSCPDLANHQCVVFSHNSLPDRLYEPSIFGIFAGQRSGVQAKGFGMSSSENQCPCTPPPSPRNRKSPVLSKEENLVFINVLMVDKDSPNYATHSENMDRLITVDFNSLDVIANIESWVVVFDFFGIDQTSGSSEEKSRPCEVKNEVSNQTPPKPADINSKLDLKVRSLTLVLVRPEYEVAKANISHLSISTMNSDVQFSWEGRLGSMSLVDLTPHGKLYRERFLTSGNQALHVQFTSYGNDEESRSVRHCDSELKIQMSSIFYVHTARFLGEIYSYFDRFSQFRALMVAMRSSDNKNEELKPSSRMLVEINAGSPVLLLPLSSASPEVLVVDLGKLTVLNRFRRAGSDGTVTSDPPEGTTTVSCLLDVMSLDLVNMDLYAGIRESNTFVDKSDKSLEFGSIRIVKEGPSLWPDKCHLKLQIDRNLDTHLSREVPDLSIKGTLEKLEVSLDLSQYKLIRGLLSYNIGENLQDLYYFNQNSEFLGNTIPQENINEPVWLMNSIHLDLVNVVVHLRQKHGEGDSLACVNFIKSRLVVETFSDRSQDIDLVSAEILITDTRFNDEPVDKRNNVFTNILQPLSSKNDPKHSKISNASEKKDESDGDKFRVDSDDDTVQAEIHHRRRKNYSKATVLLHNMRLMAVLDWWEIIKDFVLTNSDLPTEISQSGGVATSSGFGSKQGNFISGSTGVVTKCPPVVDSETIPYEFKLNITDSEIVLVEDTSISDSNAIILKSTTVISYRPEMLEKPLSCNLNHCEVFSCILGMEEETALSIIDPVTVNMEVTLRTALSEARGISDAVYTSADRTLEIQMQHLCIRLSYHDFKMLSQMLDSVPKQTYTARNQANEQDNYPTNVKSQIVKLGALGFSSEDCIKALEVCNGQLDDAALWLTQNATHVPDESKSSPDSRSAISFQTIEVKLACLSICVIDDCRDADVPLLELSMSQLSLKQEIEGAGTAKFLFTSDYYNRVLSGWEPFIEPWKCSLHWERSLSSSLLRNRLQIHIVSEELLNINVTSTLLELYSVVKNNWTQDYCSPHKSQGDDDQRTVGLRRRSPFVPFALKNDTGSVLWFTVLIKTSENLSDNTILEQDKTWVKVLPNETVPLSFGGRGKVRHRDTHSVRVHQVAVRVDMWKPAAPVSVDKVGVYFRQAAPLDSENPLPPLRLVFAVTLEGSARKLVTVRSGLVIKNMLNESVEVKLENTISAPEIWEPTKCIQIAPNESISSPVSHSLAQIWIRPIDSQNLNRYHAFSNLPLNWMKVKGPGDMAQEIHQCHSNRDKSYRFVAVIQRENFPEQIAGIWPQPEHTIFLVSPLTVINLLPCDLHYSVKEANVRGYIKPGLSAAVHEVDCDHKFEIHFHIENFPKHGILTVASPTGSVTSRIKLHDESGRRLDLSALTQVNKGAEIKITIWAPYWIINKTSLPLVFKQEGTSNETAGQFTENEIATVVTPLLFSLSDPDASPTIQARVGALCHPDRNPQWCQNFHLQVGAQVRRLRVSQRDHRPDIVYAIGINIRPGRGRYRNTNIVTLTPRFRLHNKSSYMLQFAQKCLATTLNDPGASATYATAVKDCSLAWHWPRLDKDLHLCIRLLEIKNCLWSGGFRIDTEDSLHINVRDKHGKMHFLRVETVLQAATYFVVFTDADTMPPPIRIINFSLVAIQFFQTGSNTESLQSSVRPQTSVDYAWDQPLEPPNLTLVAPGGASATYDINSTIEDSSISLTYENFIYIAFTATFKRVDGECSDSSFDPLDVESQQLVLDCVDEYKVILNRKQHGVRSQLWRMTSEGQLQHEGSSPPRDPRSKSSYYSDKILVLDIAGTAPQPTQCVALVLRRPDKRRASTQKWRFTEDGRLCCAHNNMCVQAKDGFFGLRQGNAKPGVWQKWSEAVLGPRHEISSNGYRNTVPIEQAVSRMKMRPGSGCLSVSVTSDGPTRVLKIIDPIDVKGNFQQSVMKEKEWVSLTSTTNTVLEDSVGRDSSEFEVTLNLKAGFGVSIVSRKPPEELLFLHLKGILLNTVRTPTQRTFDCTIQDIQCDNQLFEPQCPVVLYVTRGLREDEPKKHLPAIQISAHKQTCNNSKAHIFKHLIITVKNLSLRIEERLMLKLYAMFGNHSSVEMEDAEESDFETQRMVMEATSVHATRYYFGILKFVPSTVRLSVVTSTKLPPSLQALKRKLDLTLIKFEDATVELEPFVKRHPFETAQFLINSILKHFKQELKWQAAFILGSVDFLGSPLGLMNDVTEGFSGFLEGNVGALFQNVAHGLSNSTAKVTESLSDGLGQIILDDSHKETRQRIRKINTGSSSDHIVAGFKGFCYGLYGGATSVFKQSYEGATNYGFPGFISGFGKGLVGTITKPVVGILDLATETASAVRDSSRSTLKSAPPRFRLPRCVVGPGGLLPHYSAKQSQGQEFLYNINERNYSELLLSYEILRSESEDLRILISSDSIRVFTISGLAVVVEVYLNNLYHSQPRSIEEKHTGHVLHYIELTMRADGMSGLSETIKRPRVRCDTQEIAVVVSEQINYAKALYEERSQTLISVQDFSDE